jgi:C4-dicarboxylate-binding protein DctP
MKRPKKHALILILSMSLFFVTLCSSLASGAAKASTPLRAERTLRISWTVAYAPDHPYSPAADAFKEYVEEHTDGRILVELYPAGQLGNDTELFEMLQMGTLDIHLCASPVIANFTNAMIGCDMPFIFRNNMEVMYEVLQGQTGQYLLQRLEEEIPTVKPLSYMYQPFRHFVLNKEAQSLADLKGLKLRCMQSPIHMEIFSTLGMKPVTMAYGDCYGALQQRTIDGMENDVLGVATSKFNEVAKYLVISGHFNNVPVVIMSGKTFEALSPSDQQIMREAAAKATEASYKTTIEQGERYIGLLKDSGMEIIEIDMAPLYAAVQSMIDKYCSEVPEVKRMVNAVNEALATAR